MPNFLEIISAQELQIFAQLTVAMLLGSCIGIERTMAHRLAGFRTFAMVSLGSCLYIVISNMAFAMYGAGSSFDPSRIASQIVVGVGFLAGGSIIFNREHLQGLTTSAGLWVSAAIGMAVGFQMYAIAIFVTGLTLLIFGLFWKIEQAIIVREKAKEREIGKS